MKCNCGSELRENVIECVAIDVTRVTPVIGIQEIIDGELLLEYDYNDQEDIDNNSDFLQYECGTCGRVVEKEELFEIFAEDVSRLENNDAT